MRLVRADVAELELITIDNAKTPYAILSHRWLADEDEITFRDVVDRRDVSMKRGLYKLQKCKERAVRDGLQYLWVDTCCIDKTSSQEIAESINSMFRWYREATVCYIYLHDMPDTIDDPIPKRDLSSYPSTLVDQQDRTALPQPQYPSKVYLSQPLTDADVKPSDGFRDLMRDSAVELGLIATNDSKTSVRPESSRRLDSAWSREKFRKCEWFNRSWTLQEMLAPAPAKVQFFSESWKFIDSLPNLADDVASITRVHEHLLVGIRPLSSFSVAQKMSWAANRITTKEEDRAYSLLGMFDISMGIVYGEGSRAFQRLQEELLRSLPDDSIFVFDAPLDEMQLPGIVPGHGIKVSALLASSPDAFRNSGNVVSLPQTSVRNFQMFGTDIQFSTLVRDSRAHVLVSWLYWFLELNRLPINRKAVLSCTIDGARTTMVLLNLCRQSGLGGTFLVGGPEQRRIERVHYNPDSRQVRYCRKSFKVLRQPHGLARTCVHSVIFRCNSPDMKLSLVDAPPTVSWNLVDKTLETTGASSSCTFTVSTNTRRYDMVVTIGQSMGCRAKLRIHFDKKHGDGRNIAAHRNWINILNRFAHSSRSMAAAFDGRSAICAEAKELSGPLRRRDVYVVTLVRTNRVYGVIRVLLWQMQIYIVLIMMILAIFSPFVVVLTVITVVSKHWHDSQDSHPANWVFVAILTSVTSEGFFLGTLGYLLSC